MSFIEDKQSGLISISNIAKVPDMATGWPCINCRRTIQEPDTVCPECEEYFRKTDAEAIKIKDMARLGGSKAYNTFTLERYTNKSAINMCVCFPDKNLFIWGPAGTGKTHLATALVRDHKQAQIVKPQHIYRECRGLKDGQDEQKAIDYYVDMPYLVIDDLGIEKKTEFSFSILYEIIDGRDMQEKCGMIVTSNLSLDALEQRLDDGRITSRLAGMCKVIELTGKDHRLNQRP